MCDRAIRAIACANIAQDHECRGAVLPAFADVWAMRFFAYRMQIELAHEILEARVVRSPRRFDLQPGRLSIGQAWCAVAAKYLV